MQAKKRLIYQDIKSMSTQLAHVYNVNRNAVHSVKVIFTPLEGQLKQRMVEGRKGDYLRWKGMNVYEKRIEELWCPALSPTANSGDGNKQPDASSNPEPDGVTQEMADVIKKEDVIYLTADSKNVLSALNEGKTYIVGGIVDHNRYKV